MTADHAAHAVRRIVSGGQTGADRGALDAAIDLGIPSGGWVPRGWRAEDGQVPERYRYSMSETSSAGYRERTKLNVLDSDATLILSFGDLLAEGGSALTASIARQYGRPCRHAVVPADGALDGVGLARVREWLADVGPRMRAGSSTLNVAGPRESREPGLQAAVRRALAVALRRP